MEIGLKWPGHAIIHKAKAGSLKALCGHRDPGTFWYDPNEAVPDVVAWRNTEESACTHCVKLESKHKSLWRIIQLRRQSIRSKPVVHVRIQDVREV